MVFAVFLISQTHFLIVGTIFGLPFFFHYYLRVYVLLAGCCLFYSQEGEALVKKVRGSYLFKIKASDGKVHEWLVDLTSGTGSVTKGTGSDCLVLSFASLLCYLLSVVFH